MNKQDLTANHSLDDVLYALDAEPMDSTLEELEDCFICSRDFWDSLPRAEQRRLAQQYPNLPDEPSPFNPPVFCEAQDEQSQPQH